MAQVIQNTKFIVELTEQTIKELLLAIEKVKKECTFVVDNVDVESEYSDVKFNIKLETEPHTQESLCYMFETVESIGYVRNKEAKTIQDCYKG